jgi:hypothetical protein
MVRKFDCKFVVCFTSFQWEYRTIRIDYEAPRDVYTQRTWDDIEELAGQKLPMCIHAYMSYIREVDDDGR